MTRSLSIGPLSQLCCQITDGTHDSPKLQPSGMPFIKGKHISSGVIDFNGCDYISHEDHLKVIARSKPEKGDTLFSNIGSVGATAFVNTNREFSIKNVALFKPDRSKTDPRYLYYLLSSPDVKDSLLAHRSGSAQPFISLGTLREHRVRYHCRLTDQRRVSSILSAYDDLIENNTRRIEILEEMARRLYEEWFVQFRFPGHEKVRFKESELGKIPAEWNVTRLGSLVREVKGAVNPSQVDSHTPYVGLEHIPRRSITLKEWSTADTVASSKLPFKKGDILFGKIRPYFHKVSVAPVDGICSTDTILLRPQRKEYFALALCCTSSDKFVAHAAQTSNGTKMPRANWSVLSQYPLVLPSTDLLNQFNSFVPGIVSQCQALVFKNANLRAQRDLLLPKLISGEIEISSIPSQEDMEV